MLIADPFVEIVNTPLNLQRYYSACEDPGCGAIATFSGVTRDNFQGKKTVKLEYEAFIPMAESKLKEICLKAARDWDVRKIAVAHRIGEVLVGEPSVVIAVSSAHRRDALEACQWAIDELKATVPIWKKEFFEGGEVWKENQEFRDRQGAVSRQ